MNIPHNNNQNERSNPWIVKKGGYRPHQETEYDQNPTGYCKGKPLPTERNTNRFPILRMDPHNNEIVGNRIYEFGTLYEEEKDIKNQSYLERYNNRRLIDQLRKRNADELLDELIKLIQEKNLEEKMETFIVKRKYRRVFKPPPEDEDWMARYRENFDFHITDKMRATIQRRDRLER
nr:uncharacterized protein LOC117609722 [Osmia lignaria]